MDNTLAQILTALMNLEIKSEKQEARIAELEKENAALKKEVEGAKRQAVPQEAKEA